MTRRIEVAGTRVSLAEAGTGPGTCVLVHGTGTSSRSWLRTIAPLAMRFRVVAPDLPGFGASPRHRGPVSIERYADLLNALVDHLGPGPMHLVGHSMGGLVSLTALLRRPERYERLVLIGSTAISLLRLARRPVAGLVRHPDMAAAVCRELATGVLPAPPGTARALTRSARLRRLALGFVVASPERLPADAVEALIQGTGRPGFLPAVLAHRRFDLLERLPALRHPTLVLAGDRDRLVPLSDAQRFVAAVPTASLVVVSGAGHLPMLEAPEQVNATLADFLPA